MKLLSFDIPEQQDEIAVWLERHLVGLELPRLASELTAIHEPPQRYESLTQVIGEAKLQQILMQGLRAVSLDPVLFRRLLREPLLLLELQQRIFHDGGVYWRELQSHGELQTAIEENWRAIRSRLPQSRLPQSTSTIVPASVAPSAWYARPWPWILTVMSFCLGAVVVYLWFHERSAISPPASVASREWGWNRPDALQPAASSAVYRNRLADLLRDWDQVAPKPNDPELDKKLTMRLIELYSASRRLQYSTHPLPAADARSLQQRAKEWCEDIHRIEQGIPDFGAELQLRSTNTLIERIEEDLRDENFAN